MQWKEILKIKLKVLIEKLQNVRENELQDLLLLLWHTWLGIKYMLRSWFSWVTCFFLFSNYFRLNFQLLKKLYITFLIVEISWNHISLEVLGPGSVSSMSLQSWQHQSQWLRVDIVKEKTNLHNCHLLKEDIWSLNSDVIPFEPGGYCV